MEFGKLGDYGDARQRSLELWAKAGVRQTVSAGDRYTVALRTNGSVVATGENGSGQCDVSGWTDIVSVSAGDNHTVGLKADGTVVAVGYPAQGQCSVSDWTDIVSVSAGTDCTVGLKVDGTVVSTCGTSYLGKELAKWTDIIAISAGYEHVVGIKADGTVVAGFDGEVGAFCAEIDPAWRYLKPAGYGNPEDCHHHYIDVGRRPWKYRIGGAAIVPYDEWMEYPRVCAHRGFNTVAPENSMPAYGAAIAMGADEIEFDLWWTKDGKVVSCHDRRLHRVSTGEGSITDCTYEELLQLLS